MEKKQERKLNPENEVQERTAPQPPTQPKFRRFFIENTYSEVLNTISDFCETIETNKYERKALVSELIEIFQKNGVNIPE